MKKSTKIFVIVTVVAAFILYVVQAINLNYDTFKDRINIETVKKQTVHVKRVIDGDTFVFEDNGQDIKVRLIGIDTPESVASDSYLEKTGKENTEEGKLASDYTKELIDDKDVVIETDIQETDKYGRLLAYVWLDDGRMLQEVLLESGHANIATIPPNVKYVERFQKIIAARYSDE